VNHNPPEERCRAIEFPNFGTSVEKRVGMVKRKKPWAGDPHHFFSLSKCIVLRALKSLKTYG
jgi:hypothetical protein